VTLEARGAPVDQGRAQGEALGAELRAGLAHLRASHTPLSWLLAKRRTRLGPARALARFLPWQMERSEGLARAARVSPAALAQAECAWRVRGVAAYDGTRLYLCAGLPAELAPGLFLRASVPDAGGFASIELTCAPWVGCLGGINSEGIAVLCADDRAQREPSLRFLAQELLFRARDLAAGIEHLRRRAHYAGGTGTLLVAGPDGVARWLELGTGDLRERAAQPVAPPIDYTLAIDWAARGLSLRRAEGEELTARSPATPDVRS